ncbi:uncharacterized protein TNCV_2714131 [Trichonephila clavipes]|nr:uncharacterized protein TNCV_2714131 [Trichonephila clavipes]
MKTSSVEFISRSPTPSPMERNYRRPCLFRLFVCFRFSSGLDEKGKKGIRTAADGVQLWQKAGFGLIFYVVELLDDWNVDVPSWKSPRNLESPRVSSSGFDNDSKMMVMCVDVTKQVA